MRLLINGSEVEFLSASFSTEAVIEEASVVDVITYDSTGLLEYDDGTPVEIWDDAVSPETLEFTGFVFTDDVTYVPVDGGLLHKLVIHDNTYRLAKRVIATSYQNMFAGDIIVDICETYLAGEGLITRHASRTDSNATGWAQGTLSGVVAGTDGNLKLAAAGTQVTQVYNSANWGSLPVKTLANYNATLGGLTLDSPGKAIKITAHNSSGNANTYLYWRFWNGSYTVASGDVLEYAMWNDSQNPEQRQAVDLVETTNGTGLRDSLAYDQYGISSHPSADMSAMGTDQWITRSISLPSAWVGRVITRGNIGFEAEQAGYYTLYVRGVRITNGGTTKATLFDSSMVANSMESCKGYELTPTVTTPTVYYNYGYVQGAAVSYAGVGIVRDATLDYGLDAPARTAASMELGVCDTFRPAPYVALADGGAVNVPLTQFVAGQTATGRSFIAQFNLSTTSAEVTPVLTSATFYVNPAYAMTKTDAYRHWELATDFNLGTYSNMGAGNNNLYNGGYIQTFGFAQYINSDWFYGTGGAAWETADVLALKTGAAQDIHGHLKDAGDIANGAVEADVFVPDDGGMVGFTYRTTYWGSANDSYGYCVAMNNVALQMGRGTNAASGGWTSLNSIPIQYSGWHKVRAEFSGSTHKVYVDGYLMITVTDGTFTAAGGTGPRAYNCVNNAYVKNFAARAHDRATVPSWTSPAVSLTGVTTVRNSWLTVNYWTYGGYDCLSAESSVNGTDWVSTPLNGPIASLPIGSAAPSNVYVRLKWTFPWDRIYPQVQVLGLKLVVVGTGSASGYRISPAISLDNVAGGAGASGITWDADTPTGTTLTVQTSIDAGSTWQTATNGGIVPSYTLEPDPMIDPFDADTSGDYTIRKNNGAGSASATWDVDASRVIVEADDILEVLTTKYSLVQDLEIYADITEANNGALHWRCTPGSGATGYLLTLSDDEAGGDGVIHLWRRVNWANTDLATHTGSLHHGDFNRVRVLMTGAHISIYLNEELIIDITDPSPITAGGDLGFGSAWNTGRTVYSNFGAAPHAVTCVGKSLLVKHTLTSTDPGHSPLVHSTTASMRSPLIQNGPVVGTMVVDFQKASEAVAQLATEADYWWDVNADLEPLFRPRSVWPAPFPATGGPNGNVLEGSVKVVRGNPNYLNRAFAPGCKDTTDEQVETFVGDGTTRTFTLGYPLASEPIVYLNGVQQTTGIKGQDEELTPRRRWLWAENDLTLLQEDTDELGATIPALTRDGDELEVHYYGYYNNVAVTEDAGEVARRKAAEGGTTSGYVDAVLDIPQATTRDRAFSLANAALQKYGQPGRAVEFSTYSKGLKPGMMLTVWLPELGINGDQLLIEAVGTSDPQALDGSLLYHIRASEGPVSATWAKVLGDLGAKRPSYVDRVTLGQSSTTTATSTTTEEWAWNAAGGPAPEGVGAGNSVVISVYACPIPNTTTYPSTTLYPC